MTGATVNGSGAFSFRATRVGADTTLAGIIRMVEQAQGAKLPIQALVDRVTAVFVPAVFAVAALTFLVWMLIGPEPRLTYALVNAVAVLIIACPCAMGLATPAAIMTGTGRAAELGVLFRKGEALQTLARRDADRLRQDRHAHPWQAAPDGSDCNARRRSQTNCCVLPPASKRSPNIPSARALVAAAKERDLSLSPCADFASIAGMGVTGVVGKKKLAIGAERFMTSLGLNVAPFEQDAARLADEGKTPLYVAVNGKLAAILSVADRAEADERARRSTPFMRWA